MATPQSSQADGPPYPSFRELRSDGLPVRLSPDAQRLFWLLDGVFPTSISVMKTPRSWDSLEPYFQPDTEGSGSSTWHEISQSPLTEPKVSSVEASVYDLDQWESVWLETHREHTAGDAQYITYGDLSDDERPYALEMKEDGSWEEDSDTEFLVGCCGEDRPRKKAAKLVVKPSAGNHFVTVHDYVSGKSGLQELGTVLMIVSAVHPWLMSLRENILKAKTIALGYPRSLPAEFLVQNGPEMMRIEDKEYWIRRMRGDPPTHPMPAWFFNRIRRNR